MINCRPEDEPCGASARCLGYADGYHAGQAEGARSERRRLAAWVKDVAEQYRGADPHSWAGGMGEAFRVVAKNLRAGKARP